VVVICLFASAAAFLPLADGLIFAWTAWPNFLASVTGQGSANTGRRINEYVGLGEVATVMKGVAKEGESTPGGVAADSLAAVHGVSVADAVESRREAGWRVGREVSGHS
jgi:hypothetical protein